MKLLLDACVWGGAASELRAAGFDVVWVGDWATDPGDEDILAQAVSDARIVVTLDKDFGELAVLRGMPHGGIIRLVDVGGPRQGAVCSHILEKHTHQLLAGAIVTVEPGRVRIRTSEGESAPGA